MGNEGDKDKVKNFNGERSCKYPLGRQSKWKDKLTTSCVRIECGYNCLEIEAGGGPEYLVVPDVQIPLSKSWPNIIKVQ